MFLLVVVHIGAALNIGLSPPSMIYTVRPREWRDSQQVETSARWRGVHSGARQFISLFCSHRLLTKTWMSIMGKYCAAAAPLAPRPPQCGAMSCQSAWCVELRMGTALNLPSKISSEDTYPPLQLGYNVLLTLGNKSQKSFRDILMSLPFHEIFLILSNNGM